MIVAVGVLAGRVRGNHNLAAPLGQPVSEPPGIVSPVSDQLARCGDTVQQGRSADQIVDLAWSDDEGDGPANGVGYGMNFGRPSAARSADGVGEVPPFAPAAERCALMWVESTAVVLTARLVPVRA